MRIAAYREGKRLKKNNLDASGLAKLEAEADEYKAEMEPLYLRMNDKPPPLPKVCVPTNSNALGSSAPSPLVPCCQWRVAVGCRCNLIVCTMTTCCQNPVLHCACVDTAACAIVDFASCLQ